VILTRSHATCIPYLRSGCNALRKPRSPSAIVSATTIEMATLMYSKTVTTEYRFVLIQFTKTSLVFVRCVSNDLDQYLLRLGLSLGDNRPTRFLPWEQATRSPQGLKLAGSRPSPLPVASERNLGPLYDPTRTFVDSRYRRITAGEIGPLSPPL